MADDGLTELMLPYVLRGVNEWCKDYPFEARRDTERTLNLRIAQSDSDAVAALYSRSAEAVKFIPMPRLGAPKIEWAFFSPRCEAPDSADGWVFDLFLLLEQGHHIGFRLEPADECGDARHGFSHAQLSWRFVHKSVEPAGALRWLPDSYPAFPLPGTESTDRFLMLLVALHGFPSGTEQLLREMDPNRPVRVRKFADRVNGLLRVE